jgi:methylated-DNA-[protein]-cysteine S-methyltransferase
MHGRAYLETPLGLVEVVGAADGVAEISFVTARKAGAVSNATVRAAARQVGEYFAGARRAFELPLAPHATDFQRQVWSLLLGVPFGSTIAYGELAAAVGRPGAARAVGAAVGRNPVAVVVPCHRVLGMRGQLTGYGGGLWRKEWLLKHEGAQHTAPHTWSER